mmetsp:Transcript_73071/g.116201  ORF Transcript_73071/g.116201 Transcript_73071/m.116201 type:complete len:233 (-) Transcript_73071:373-1071(-)
MLQECTTDLLALLGRPNRLEVRKGIEHTRSTTTSHLSQQFRPRVVEPTFVTLTLVNGEASLAKNQPLLQRGHSDGRYQNIQIQKRWPRVPVLALGVEIFSMKAPKSLRCHDQAELHGQLATATRAMKASTTWMRAMILIETWKRNQKADSRSHHLQRQGQPPARGGRHLLRMMAGEVSPWVTLWPPSRQHHLGDPRLQVRAGAAAVVFAAEGKSQPPPVRAVLILANPQSGS